MLRAVATDNSFDALKDPAHLHGSVYVCAYHLLALSVHTSGSKLFTVCERAKKHTCDVNEHPVIADHNMKFRTFICLLLRCVVCCALSAMESHCTVLLFVVRTSSHVFS